MLLVSMIHTLMMCW